MGKLKYLLFKLTVEKFLTSDYMVKKVVRSLQSNLKTPPFSSRFLLKSVLGNNFISKFILKYYNERKQEKGTSTRIVRTFGTSNGGVDLMKKLLYGVNKNCRNSFIKNIIVRGLILFYAKRELYKNLPSMFTMVISPTMKCNLNCVGCYAGNYTKEKELSYKTLDRIFTEAVELDIPFISISGGEPFVRKDLLKLFEKHKKIWFQVYTNGTLIDEKLAKKLAKLGNVAPAISIEGFEKDTTLRRGKGTYEKIMNAMDNLKKHGVIFGFSVTGSRYNTKFITSKKFIDLMIKKGCMFGWYFHYQPIGMKPDPKLMLKPEQREKIRNFVKKTRLEKPLFLIDFLADGAYIDGCMAAGKEFLHINNKGDIEPCVFCHFSVDNIHKTTLRESLNSKFFRAIRNKQPYRDNMLTPCLIADNSPVLRELYKKYKPKPTHVGADSIIYNKKLINHLKKYDNQAHKILDKKWKEIYKPELDSEMK